MLSLTFRAKVGSYDIFYTVIYVTLILLTGNWNVFVYCYLRAIYFFVMSFKIFIFGQIKINILKIKNDHMFTISQM